MKHRIRHKGLAAGLVTALAALTVGLAAEKKPSWLDTSRLTAAFRWSEDVQESVVDALIPVWQPGDSRIFLDIRGSFLEDEEQEVNGGVVFRHLLRDPGLVLGLNAFYDTRWTENDNTFDQVGFGLEVLSRYVDVRFNYYLPLDDEELLRQASSEESSTAVSNGRRVTTTTTRFFNIYEEALEGYDTEVGVWLPFLDKVAPTAIYGGYFDFDSSYDDDIAGFKARIESRIHPNVTLDAEWYETEDLNRTDYFVGVRVNVPLDFWNGVQRGQVPAEGEAAPHPLEARMNEMVNRDFRIRTRVTDPVPVGHSSTETVARSGSTPTQPDRDRPDFPILPPRPEPPPPPPPPPPDNCRIDPITGDVVCD